MVFSIAHHFLHDCWLAEELAQEVFLQLHLELPKLKSSEHVKYWLRKVTSHRSIDYGRRRRPPKVRLEQAPEPAAEAHPGDPILAMKLGKLVAALPPKARLIVILRYQEGLEPQEIAQLLEMPSGTVKSNLQRALAVLRRKTAHWLGGDGL